MRADKRFRRPDVPFKVVPDGDRSVKSEQSIRLGAPPDGPLAGLLNALTFPFLRPVRRIVPPIGGTLDLSPLIVIVLAQLALLLPVTWLESTLTRAFI